MPDFINYRRAGSVGGKVRMDLGAGERLSLIERRVRTVSGEVRSGVFKKVVFEGVDPRVLPKMRSGEQYDSLGLDIQRDLQSGGYRVTFEPWNKGAIGRVALVGMTGAGGELRQVWHFEIEKPGNGDSLVGTEGSGSFYLAPEGAGAANEFSAEASDVGEAFREFDDLLQCLVRGKEAPPRGSTR